MIKNKIPVRSGRYFYDIKVVELSSRYEFSFATDSVFAVICVFKTEEGRLLNYINITFVEGDKDEYVVEVEGS